MKFLAWCLFSLFFSTNVFASIDASMTCVVGKYNVEISQNVNENLKNPLSIIRVFKNGVEVYSEFYKRTYQTISSLEVWEYEGYNHSDGSIGLAATSHSSGKADIYIDLNASDEVVGNSVDCAITR